VADFSLAKANPKDGGGGRLLSPERLREAVEHARDEYGVSERKVCALVGPPRGTQRYVPAVREDEDLPTQAIVRLACRYGRYGTGCGTSARRPCTSSRAAFGRTATARVSMAGSATSC